MTQTLLEIAKRRAPPAILIFSPSDHLLFANAEARKILSDGEKLSLPPEIPSLCRRLKQEVTRHSGNSGKGGEPALALFHSTKGPYVVRAFWIVENWKGRVDHLRIMVLLEKLVLARAIDMESVTDRFHLTPREQNIVEFLTQGYTNKEIGVFLGIEEYTVKDHVKNIMHKLHATTRTGIVAKILQV